MKRNNMILYLISISLFIFSFVMFFFPVKNFKLIVAVLLLIYVILTNFFIKKRNISSINKGQMSLLFFILGILFLLVLYLLGLSFGFSKAIYVLSIPTIFNFIVPIIVIVVAYEFIRNAFLSQEDNNITILSFIIGVCVDLFVFTNLDLFANFDVFMSAIGIALLPAIASNILYTYISKNFGAKPNIIFRLITCLYLYIIPVTPNIPELIFAFIKLIFPVLMYIILTKMYEKKKRFQPKSKKTTFSYIITGFLFTIMISIMMLVSCQFKYCMIVIGSDSMKGAFSTGDVVIYEKYDNQIIEENQIIAFKKNEVLTIHRVISVENINGEIRFTTKGDANESLDEGYVFQDQIVGVVNFKISYIGYPSIFIRNLLK